MWMEVMYHFPVWPIKIPYNTWFSTFFFSHLLAGKCRDPSRELKSKDMVQPKVKEAWIRKSPYRRLCTMFYVTCYMSKKYTSTVIGHCDFEFLL